MNVLFSLLDAAIGGGQRVAIDVARRIAIEGDGIGLLVPDDGPAVDEFRALGAAVYRADLQTLWRTTSVARSAQLARSFDLLYSHTSVPGEVLGGRVVRRAGIGHVVHRHTDPHFSPQTLTRSIQKRLYRRELCATPFIAVSQHVVSALVRLGIEPGRITMVSNGVDVEATRNRGSDIIVGEGRLAVGALGRFDPSRGLDTFTEAVRRVTDPGVKFVIGGASGPFSTHEAEVRSSAAEASVELREPGPSGVEFLASLNIVVIPSRYEGSPLTLFEAMALGKPIIASRIPGIAEVLEPSGAGMLVPPEDPAALAAAITSLVADPARCEALGQTALDVVRSEHGLDGVLDRIIAVLHSSLRAT